MKEVRMHLREEGQKTNQTIAPHVAHFHALGMPNMRFEPGFIACLS